MSSLILATPSLTLRETFARALGGGELVLLDVLPRTVADLLAPVPPTRRPSMIVLDALPEESAALALAAAVRSERPGVAVLLVAADSHRIALPALRAGVFDIVAPDISVDDLVRLLARVPAQPAASAPLGTALAGQGLEAGETGRVISVVSPKGGVGKTTVATNLAVGLARIAPRATVLVDLDLQFGDVASGLNLDPEYFLHTAVQAQGGQDPMVLKSHLTLHETGLYVICAPDTPAGADAVTPADVAQLLSTLKNEFRFVVVDTAPGLSDFTLAALDHTTDPVLLTSMDVPGLRGLRKEIDTLRDLSLLPDERHIVLNFADPRAGLSMADIQATIGARVDVLLPRSKAVPASVNLGVPLLQSGTRDPMTKQLQALVTRLTADTVAAPAPVTLRGFEQRRSRPAPRRAASGWFRRPVAVAR